MKFLKYLLVGLLIIVVLFFSVGLLKNSVSYGHEVEVDAPIKKSWAVSQDESYYADWLEGFQSIELLSGEKGAEGSTYRVVVNPGEGQPDFEMIETVKSLVPNDHVEMHFDSDFMNFEQIMTFKEKDGGTVIKTESKVIGKNIMTKSMFAWMEILGGSFTAQEAKNIEALKRVIENAEDDQDTPIQQELMQSDTVQG